MEYNGINVETRQEARAIRTERSRASFHENYCRCFSFATMMQIEFVRATFRLAIRPPSVLDEFIASYFFSYCLYESEGSPLNVTGKSLNDVGGDHVMHAKLLSKCLEDYARKRE